MSRLKLESSNQTSPISSYPPSMVDMATSMGENLSVSMVLEQNVSPKTLMHQDRLPHSGSSPHPHLDQVGKENIEKKVIISRLPCKVHHLLEKLQTTYLVEGIRRMNQDMKLHIQQK